MNWRTTREHSASAGQCGLAEEYKYYWSNMKMWHFSASYKIHTKTSTQTQTVNIPSYACVFQHGSSWWEIGFARTVDCQTPVVASAIQSTNKNSLKIMKRSTTTNTQRNQSRSAGWRVTWPLSRALLKQKYAIMPTCTVHLAWLFCSGSHLALTKNSDFAWSYPLPSDQIWSESVW